MTYAFKIVSGTYRARFGITKPHPDWTELERQLNEFSTSGWEVMSTSTSSAGKLFLGIGNLETVLTAVLRKPIHE